MSEDVPLPELGPGDVVAVDRIGAYSLGSASHTNAEPKPPVVLVRTDGTYDLIGRRESCDDVLGRDSFPRGYWSNEKDIWNDERREKDIRNGERREKDIWNGARREKDIRNDACREKDIWNGARREKDIWNGARREKDISNGEHREKDLCGTGTVKKP